MNTECTFILDSDVFIAAKNSYYAFAICPGFWDSLIHYHGTGRVYQPVEEPLSHRFYAMRTVGLGQGRSIAPVKLWKHRRAVARRRRWQSRDSTRRAGAARPCRVRGVPTPNNRRISSDRLHAPT